MVFSHKILIKSIVLTIPVATAVFLLLPGIYAFAYDVRCPSSTNGVAVEINGRNLSFSNQSSDCRQIGVAVYRLASETQRENAFYYSKTFGLQAGQRAAFAVPVPPCAYVIDAFVGEPAQTVHDKAGYGSLLLKSERGGATNYCPGISGNAFPTVSPNHAILPRTSPPSSPGDAEPAPLPKVSKAPVVLGAATSVKPMNPLSVATGGDGTIALVLLAGAVLSGAAVWAQRRSCRLDIG